MVKAVEESGITPLDYLLSIMRDQDAQQSYRMAAARIAAPYVHPRLATAQVQFDPPLSDMTDDELEAQIDKLVRKMGYVTLDRSDDQLN